MKIVIVHTDLRVHWKARLSALHKFLSEKGFELSIVEIAGKGSPYAFYNDQSDSDIQWHCIFPDSKIEDIQPAAAKRAVIKTLNNIKPDVVLSGAIAYSSGAGALEYCLNTNTKLIVFDNARLEDVPRSRYVNFIKRKLYDCVDAIFCPAPPFNETFNYWGFNDKQIFHGLNVVDNKYFSGNNSGSSHNDKKTLLAVGRQIPKKNFLGLLNVWTNLTKKGKSTGYELLFVGDGPEHNNLIDFVESNNLQNVSFMPFQNHEELKIIYHDSSALILPSVYGETWGLVVNEAMAAGLPVLVSDRCGCASTLVRNGENGYTFDPENYEEMEAVLNKYLELSPEQMAKIGKNSEAIIEEWDLDRYCRGVWEAIQFVVSQKEKRRGDLFSKLFVRLWNGRYRPV